MEYIYIPYWTRYNYIYQNYLNAFALYNKALEIYYGDLNKYYNLCYNKNVECYTNYQLAIYYATLNAEKVAYSTKATTCNVEGSDYYNWSLYAASKYSCVYVYNANGSYTTCKWIPPLGDAAYAAATRGYNNSANAGYYMMTAGNYVLQAETSVNVSANYVYLCALLLSYF